MTVPGRRRWIPFLIGLAVTAGLLLAAVLLATRTEPGRERILAITLQTVGGLLHPDSRLEVQRLDGGLLTRARAHGITVYDPTGEVMVVADSAHLGYRLASFFGGDVRIDDLVVYGARVWIHRMPEDSLWNYQQLFQDTTAVEEDGGPGRATILSGLRLIDGQITVRLPWEPSDDIGAAEQEVELAEALSDSSRVAVAAAPGGYLRSIEIEAHEVEIEDLTIADDRRGGTYLRVADADATVGFYRDRPIRVQGMSGELNLREGVVRFTAPEVRMPASVVAGEGVLDLSGDEPRYDVVVRGTGVALRDLQWLYPAFPDDGRASFAMVVETTPEALFLRATDLDLAAEGTRLSGGFSVLLGDSMLFSDVTLRADPLDMETVRRMLPVEVPVRGLKIGSVVVESSAS